LASSMSVWWQSQTNFELIWYNRKDYKTQNNYAESACNLNLFCT
jgi:hypothetical protein